MVLLRRHFVVVRLAKWFGGVLPECRGSGHRGEAKMGEVSFESVVGNAAGLLEAGNTFSDL